MAQQNALEQIWEKNQKAITYGGIALVALAALYFFYTTYYLGSRNEEAINKMAQAETMFRKDSFNLALNNPGGGYPGFIKVISDYSGTKSANTAKLYAGLCYLNLAQYDKAIEYLNDFDESGKMIPSMKYGALGDAYAEKKDMANALKYYQKAASAGNNETLQAFNLFKVGMLSEKQGNKAAALEAYQNLKKKFPTSSQARDIDKYIIRAGGTVN